MKKTVGFLLFFLSVQGLTFASGGAEIQPIAEGLAVVNPVQERSCIALRVDVPGNKAVSGIQWFNGADDHVFPKILVGSGAGDVPPDYASCIVVAEDVIGQKNAWSELEFSEPVASFTGTLFVIMQFPAFYVPPEDALSLGVGYREFQGENLFYVSRDGDSWYALSTNFEFLLNPLFVERSPNIVALSAPGMGPELVSSEEIPEESAFKAYPNPFNPTIQLRLELDEAAYCDIKIYDLKGHLVTSLHSGNLPAGIKVFNWGGTDRNGRRLSSGVYWAKVKAGKLSFTERMVMLK